MASIDNLIDTVARLRAPDGCPWDREQTHRSLCGGMIEEVAEFIETVDLDEKPHMCEELGDPITVEEMARRKNQLYLEIALKGTPIYPEMLKFIKMLVREGIPIALASGTSSAVLNRLVYHLGLQQYFDAVISSEEVEKSKPEPDVFLAAAEKLHTMPENCLVIEDSAFGIEAGLRAGMQVMAVPYITDAPLDEIFSKSDILFPQGQTEFTAEKAMVWFNDRYLQE